MLVKISFSAEDFIKLDKSYLILSVPDDVFGSKDVYVCELHSNLKFKDLFVNTETGKFKLAKRATSMYEEN